MYWSLTSRSRVLTLCLPLNLACPWTHSYPTQSLILETRDSGFTLAFFSSLYLIQSSILISPHLHFFFSVSPTASSGPLVIYLNSFRGFFVVLFRHLALLLPVRRAEGRLDLPCRVPRLLSHSQFVTLPGGSRFSATRLFILSLRVMLCISQGKGLLLRPAPVLHTAPPPTPCCCSGARLLWVLC